LREVVGLRLADNTRGEPIMVTDCAWCPVTEETERAIRQGVPVSHGICEYHYLELMVKIQGEGSLTVGRVSELARAMSHVT
jgi:hypothetical protein